MATGMGFDNLWQLLSAAQSQQQAPPRGGAAQGQPIRMSEQRGPVLMGPPLPPEMLPKRLPIEPPAVELGPVTPAPDVQPSPQAPITRGPAGSMDVKSQIMGSGLNKQQQAMIDELMAAQEAELERQRGLVAQAEGMDAQMDLRPLAAFVDSMTGSKSAASLAPTFTEADKLRLVSQLRENVAQGQEKLTSTKLKQLMGEEGLDLRKLMMIQGADRRTAAEERAAEKRDLETGKIVTNFFNQMERHPVIKKLAEQDASFDQLQDLSDLAEAGNATAFSSIGTKMAKAMGEVGVLTENDVKRYVQSKQLSRSAADTLQKWMTGSPTQATMQDIQSIAKAMQRAAHSKMDRFYKRHAQALAENIPGMTIQDAYKKLAIPTFEDGPKAKSGGGGIQDMTDEELNAKINKLKGGKP